MNRHKCRNMTNYCINNIELTTVQMCVMVMIHKTQNNRKKQKEGILQYEKFRENRLSSNSKLF